MYPFNNFYKDNFIAGFILLIIGVIIYIIIQIF